MAGESAELEDAIGSIYAQQKQWDEARKRFEHAVATGWSAGERADSSGSGAAGTRGFADALTMLEAMEKADPPDVNVQ